MTLAKQSRLASAPTYVFHPIAIESGLSPGVTGGSTARLTFGPVP
jgi:hypothetical protein